MSERRHFAAGDFLTRNPENGSYEWLIESPFEKSGWKSRDYSLTAGAFPGSAIKFEDRFYEIVRMERNPNGIHYFLNNWEERFPLRVPFIYSREECHRLAMERKKEKTTQNIRVGIFLMAPLVGLLPEADQKRLGNELGISPTRLTLISALCMLVPGGAALIFTLVLVLQQPIGSITLNLLGSYLFLESLVRIYCSMKLEEPMGSLFIALPVKAIRALVTNTKPQGQQKEILRKNSKPLAKDEITLVEDVDHDLEVVSILPKPHWNSFTGIHYEDKWYGLIESQAVGMGQARRYKFLLKEAPLGFCFRKTSEYEPDEVNRLRTEEKKQEHLTWVRTFSLFWGLLSETDQDRLSELYDFDALKFTFITFLALGALAAANLVSSIANIAAHRGSLLDLILLLAAVYLLCESVSRWLRWRAGRPSGSFLGNLVRPFAKRLLE